jgi:hypothetical protein
VKSKLLAIPIIMLAIIFTISPLFIINVSAETILCKKCGSEHDEAVECTLCEDDSSTGKVGCGLPIGPRHHTKNASGEYTVCQACPLCSTDQTKHWHNYGNIKASPSAMAAYDFVCKAYGGINDTGTPGKDNAAEKQFEDQTSISIGELITLSANNNAFGLAFEATKTAYESISLIGSIMVFIYFIMELVDMSLNDNLAKEQVAKMFIKSLLGFLLIRNGYSILLMTINQVETITMKIGSFSAFKTPNGVCYGSILQQTTAFDDLGIIFEHIMPAIVSGVCFCVVRIIVWTRVLDVLIRMTFAPIGLADFIRGGSKSNAIRYLKKLLSSLLQGACIIAALASYNLIYDAVKSSIPGVLGSILVGLAVITTVKQTGRIASEIIGE